MMKIKLGQRLIISYFSLSMVIIGMISFILNFNIKRGFEQYIIEEHQLSVAELVMDIESAYDGDKFDVAYIETLGINAIEKGFIISVSSPDHDLVWSAMEHNAGLCEEMITNVKQNMFDNYSNWDGQYTEDIYPLRSGGIQIGNLQVGYLGPFYFNEEELYFLSSINQTLIFVGAASLFIAVAIGIINGRSLSRPIHAVINRLNNINDSQKVEGLQVHHKTVELEALEHAALKLEQRIYEQEKLRKQLTQDMAHELKTPITAIQGQLEAMIDGIFPITQERIESSYEEIIRIKSLILEIEELAIEENHNINLNFELFKLEDLITKVFSDFEPDLIKNHIQTRILHGANYNSRKYQNFYGAKDKLCQVFVNLTSNAIKYAGPNAVITIILDVKDNQYFIKFIDNGPGINEADRPYVFERFFRSDPSRTGHNGFGIGLTLVKSMIAKHGGTIEYDGTYQDGACFNIKIPINPKEKKYETLT